MDSGIGIEVFLLVRMNMPVIVLNSIDEVTKVITRPISAVNSRPFIFEIPGDFEKFTDAESFKFHGKMRIKKKVNGEIKDIDDTDYVGPVNNMFDSLWSKVNVKVNDKAINDPTNSWYAYKAYFENHLSYSKGTKTNLLSYRGYINETRDKFDDVGSETASVITQTK